MCCRSHVTVLDPEALEFVMERGLFVPTYKQPETGQPITWERRFPEEGTAVTVNGSEGYVALSISPSISMYSQHKFKRLAASALFEVATKYAMAVNGEVIQRGLVSGCRPSGVSGDVVIASYPHQHLHIENICEGFQRVLNGDTEGFPLDDDDAEERRLIPW